MPTYEYRCKACEHEFELFQNMSDSVKRKCPSCAKNQLERLIGTGAAVIFKGGGFYETDYRSESYKKDAKADKAESKTKAETKSGGEGSSSSESSKNDAKPKSETKSTEPAKTSKPEKPTSSGD